MVYVLVFARRVLSCFFTVCLFRGGLCVHAEHELLEFAERTQGAEAHDVGQDGAAESARECAFRSVLVVP